MPTTTISRCGGGAAGQTYAQVVTGLKSSYTLVAEWDLDEGASPYADTSGFSPGDPSTMTRQVRVVPMTQSFTPGPLVGAQGAPAVAFNFDGTNATSSSDYLTDAIANPSRYYFLGNLPFTVIFWAVPFAGVNTHDGPVVSTVHVTSFGQPTAHDDGWMLNVTQPGRIPRFSRYAAVTVGNSPDSASGSALSTASWSMLAGTYDGATLKLYVNGALASSAASAGAITSISSNATIGLGAKDQGNTISWHYGAAGKGSVWAATLTAADILALWTAGTS